VRWCDGFIQVLFFHLICCIKSLVEQRMDDGQSREQLDGRDALFEVGPGLCACLLHVHLRHAPSALVAHGASVRSLQAVHICMLPCVNVHTWQTNVAYKHSGFFSKPVAMAGRNFKMQELAKFQLRKYPCHRKYPPPVTPVAVVTGASIWRHPADRT
jgi:hypothetical protein